MDFIYSNFKGFHKSSEFMACDMIYSGMSFTEMIDFSLFGEKCEIVQGGVWEIGKETENGFRIWIDWVD